MSKRTAEEMITIYREKIRKLEEKKKENSRRRRRAIIYSDSSDSEDNENRTKQTENTPVRDKPLATTSRVSPAAAETTGGGTDSADASVIEPSLDPDILSALGAQPDDELEYGPKIHDNLSQLWLPILKKGIPKEEKDKIFKNYLVPENCKLLQAPKLNLEIAAAITESARGRDKKISSEQQQLGIGISAVNRALDVLIAKEENSAVKAIKHLSEACRLLCDLHYNESQARIKLITPSLDKNFINILQDMQRDETLFGNKLSEKIKSSKAIKKQGLQIKKFILPNSATSSSTPRPSGSRGNWSAPPRYSSSKSGRDSSNKASSFRKPPPPPPPAATTAANPKQVNKRTRAQTRQ
ncbi:hypothetical protein NE865_09552 [Phthorimaea operculella]|nr:hypothetical protein NE865_09552 [Phthorimaea operculella]